jgi:hypothetical protein
MHPPFPVLRVDHRDAFVQVLLRNGVDSYVFAQLPRLALAVSGFPEAAALRSDVAGLPVRHQLSRYEIERMVEVLSRLLPRHAGRGPSPRWMTQSGYPASARARRMTRS